MLRQIGNLIEEQQSRISDSVDRVTDPMVNTDQQVEYLREVAQAMVPQLLPTLTHQSDSKVDEFVAGIRQALEKLQAPE